MTTDARETVVRWECVDCETVVAMRPCEQCGSTDVEAVLSSGERCDVLDLDPRGYEVVDGAK